MKKIWKENAKIVLIIFISVALASGATYATVTMYDSNIVSYDNTTSGLNSTNVQGALDELYGCATNYSAYETRLAALEAVIGDVQEIYPVGSIYTSIDSTNPSSLFGGTWEAFGTGKTLVGVDTSDTSFDTVEETGGAKTKSYTPAGTIGNTTLTTDQIPSHTHNYVKATGVGNHTLTTSEIPSHNHTVYALAAGTMSTPYHLGMQGDGNFVMYDKNGSAKWDSGTNGSGSSFRTFDLGRDGTTSSNGGGGSHNHPLNTSTVASVATGGGGSHTHSFTGTATSIDVVQPYITVYMWKRTA